MPSIRSGAIHLFRLAGVDVFLHWSWFLVAAYEIQARDGRYSSVTWSVLEYLALFFIVLTHEFGHAMACRQVGGTANRIVLWPMGGVAFVNPPQRPGATLWSIAAGPLVNVALLPILIGAFLVSRSLGWAHTMPDAYMFVKSVLWINTGLLIFNMLPIYPLDGGQILRSVLWFGLGRARSLMTATILGFVGVVGFIVLAVVWHSVWTGAVAVFILVDCSTREGCCGWRSCRGGKVLPAPVAEQRRRWEPIGSAGSVSSPSTHLKPMAFARTARRSMSRLCALTARNSVS